PYPFTTDMAKYWNGTAWIAYETQAPYDDAHRPRIFEYQGQPYAIVSVGGTENPQDDTATCDQVNVSGSSPCTFNTLTIGPWIYGHDCPNGVCPSSPGTVTDGDGFACHPGLSPEATVQNVTVRYNEIRNADQGMEI